MAIWNDFLQVVVKEFRGSWLTLEPGDVPPANGLLAQNVEYLPGLVKTRLGYGSVQNPGDSVLSMRTWLAPSFSGITSFLMYLAGAGSTNTGINQMTLSTGAVSNLYNPAGSPVGAIFDFGGVRVFIATYNAAGLGSDSGRVFTPTSVAINGGLDKLFAPPISVAPVITNNGAGLVTAGSHSFGYLIITRGGLTVAPSPVDITNTFVPTVFVAPGGTQLLFSITTTWPTYASSIQVIMTTAGGAQYLMVPGGTAGVLGGVTSTANIGINISDGVLAASGTDATPFFSQIAISGGLDPFKPSFLINYSQRMVYVGLDAIGTYTLFVSDQNAYQSISLARNVVYLPGQLPIVACFSLYNVLYILGPHWTYAVQDNGGNPVTWASPQLIDGQVGTVSPQGITVNAAQGVAWVAATDGLYLFAGGAYSTRPISYYQATDWGRINWAVGGQVQVIDNKETHQVLVLAPLDGAATPTHVLAWDYTRGLDAESVNYSLNNFSAYSLGSIGKVQNDSTKHIETWLGPSDHTLPILRQNSGIELNPYRDNGQPILSVYQTSLFPSLMPAPVQHHGDMFRLEGFGNTYITAYGLDGQVQKVLDVLNENLYPAQQFLRPYHLISEAASLVISNQANPPLPGDTDNWFQLSEITHYFTNFISKR